LTKTESIFDKNQVGAKQKPSRFLTKTESIFQWTRSVQNKNRVGIIDAIALPVVIIIHSHINNFETNGTP